MHWSLLKQRQRTRVKYLNTKKKAKPENRLIHDIFIRDLESVMVRERNYKLQVVVCKGVTLIFQKPRNRLYLQHCRAGPSKAWKRDSSEGTFF